MMQYICWYYIVSRTLSSLKHHSFVAIAAKYGISSHNVSFKKAVWQTFSSAVLAKVKSKQTEYSS